jgi:hypothetical protein
MHHTWLIHEKNKKENSIFGFFLISKSEFCFLPSSWLEDTSCARNKQNNATIQAMCLCIYGWMVLLFPQWKRWRAPRGQHFFFLSRMAVCIAIKSRKRIFFVNQKNRGAKKYHVHAMARGRASQMTQEIMPPISAYLALQHCVWCTIYGENNAHMCARVFDLCVIRKQGKKIYSRRLCEDGGIHVRGQVGCDWNCLQGIDQGLLQTLNVSVRVANPFLWCMHTASNTKSSCDGGGMPACIARADPQPTCLSCMMHGTGKKLCREKEHDHWCSDGFPEFFQG